MTKVVDILAALDAAIDSIETVETEIDAEALDSTAGTLDHAAEFLDHEKEPWSKENASVSAALDHLDKLDHENKRLACARPPQHATQGVDRENQISAQISYLHGPNGPNHSKPFCDNDLSLDHGPSAWSNVVQNQIDRLAIGGNIYSLDAARAFRAAFLASNAPGPDGDDVSDWRLWMRSRVYYWIERGRTKDVSVRLAWGEAQNEWHKRHGAEPNRDRCAGCDRWLMDEPGMALPDGARVHTGLDCLIFYGETWRGAATAGLIRLGINPPKPLPEDGQ